MMPDASLVKAFHEEMLAFVDRYVELSRAFYEEGLEKLPVEDLIAEKFPADSICIRLRDQDRALMRDLTQRFEAANIGNWNEHMVQSGAFELTEKIMSYLPLEGLDGP